MVLTTEDKCKDKKGCCQTVVNVVAENAYDLWKREGNTGTLQDFLESLKGEKGDKGEQGIQGEKGEKGDRLSIKEIISSRDDLASIAPGDGNYNIGDLILVVSGNDDNGELYVLDGSGPRLLTNLKGVDGVNGKSAYQTWLDLGNTGSEQDFINSLKANNDFGEVERKTVEVNEDIISLWTSLPRSRMFTYNKKLGVGSFRLDFTTKVDTPEWVRIVDLVNDNFYPRNPQDKAVWGTGGNGTGNIIIIGSINNGQQGVWVKNLVKGERYTVDFDGFWKFN